MEITKTVKQLLIINIVLFILTYFKLPIVDFKLYSSIDHFRVYQLVSYMFLHGDDLPHIIFNMIGLVVFGSDIERKFGSSNFLKIYLISGIVSGICHILFIDKPVLGASGAVWSLMVMYALYNPENIFHIYFFIPVKIKYIVSVFFIIELYLSVLGNDGTSHIAHIGGALMGFIFYRLNKHIV